MKIRLPSQPIPINSAPKRMDCNIVHTIGSNSSFWLQMKLLHLSSHLNICTEIWEPANNKSLCSSVGNSAAQWVLREHPGEAIPAQHTTKVTHMDRAVEVGGCIRVLIYLTFKWVWARARTNSEILMCCNHQRSHWSQCSMDATCVSKSYSWQCFQSWDAVHCAAVPVCASNSENSLLFHYLPSPPTMKPCSWDTQFRLLHAQGSSVGLQKVVRFILRKKNSSIRYTLYYLMFAIGL